MSISSTIRTLRKNEILADLPKMNVTDLMSKRTELRTILRSNTSESQLNKDEISDITMAISRELTSRAETHEKATGIDPASQSQAILASAKNARKAEIESNASRKLQQERDVFDRSSALEQLSYVEEKGKSPHGMEAFDFVSSADKSAYFGTE